MIDTLLNRKTTYFKDPGRNEIPFLKEITCYRLEYHTGEGLFNTRIWNVQTNEGRNALSQIKAFHEEYFPGPACTRLCNIDLGNKMNNNWLFAFNSIEILNQNINKSQLITLAYNNFKIYEITTLGYQDHVQSIFDPNGNYSKKDITSDLINSNIFN